MTKTELASKANISISFISDVTRDNGNPSLKIMERVARALGVPLPLLFEAADLDEEAVSILSGGDAVVTGLPPGYEWVTGILPSFEAYQFNKKSKATRQLLRKKRLLTRNRSPQ